MSVTIANDGPLGALTTHVYMRTASTALAAWSVAATDAVLAAASHFQKVDASFELVSAKGDSVTTTTGIKFVTTAELAGNLKAYGLSSVDYKALMNTTTGYNLKDVDIFLLQAPANQATGTCAIGQQIFESYAVNAFVFLEVKAGVPIAVNIAWERTDSAENTNIEWNVIVA